MVSVGGWGMLLCKSLISSVFLPREQPEILQRNCNPTGKMTSWAVWNIVLVDWCLKSPLKGVVILEHKVSLQPKGNCNKNVKSHLPFSKYIWRWECLNVNIAFYCWSVIDEQEQTGINKLVTHQALENYMLAQGCWKQTHCKFTCQTAFIWDY